MTSEEFRSNPKFLRNQFQGDGIFELPMIKRQEIALDGVELIGYDKTKLDSRTDKESFVHFFLDDYKFEVIWNDPEPRLEKLRQYRGVLSPQFSAYYTMPFAMQLYQTFRSRWCGAYLQSKGLTVIPTVYWGKPQSYWYCFDGIEKGSIVAVSTLGVRREKDFFLQGYGELLRRIEPETVICYGATFPEMQGKVIEVGYAETNHLEHKRFWTVAWNGIPDKPASIERAAIPSEYGIYVFKTGGCVLTGYGGGGGSGRGRSEYKKPKPGNGKERATDIPSWAKGERPYKGENGDQFAKRLLDQRYGPGNYSTDTHTEYSRLKKHGDRGFL